MKKRKILIFLGLLSVFLIPTPADAAVEIGDLIKRADRPEIYYIGSDHKRYHIPNPETYFSWYKDFSKIRTVSKTDYFSIPVSSVRVTVRPGSRLVKFEGSPHVYAVDTGARLRWIDSELTAFKRFGLFWFVGILTLPQDSFEDYELGPVISAEHSYSRARASVKSPTIDQELRSRGYIPPRRPQPDRSESDDGIGVTLKGLRENLRASLNPRFNPSVSHYTLTANSNEAHIKIRPLRTDKGHTVKINGVAVLGGKDARFRLKTGINHFAIEVSDAIQKMEYTLDVTRESGSSNADIAAIGGNLKHSFDNPITPDRHEYNIDANYLRDIWRMRVTTADKKAAVYVNGKKSKSGKTNSVRLNYGKNTVVIRIVSQAGSEKEYIVHVHRSQFAGVDDLDLKSLSENLRANLAPQFNPKVSRYFLRAAPHESSVQIRATAKKSAAHLYIDNRRTRSKTIQLNEGKNEITVRVQLGSHEKEYTVTVDRLPKRD